MRAPSQSILLLFSAVAAACGQDIAVPVLGVVFNPPAGAVARIQGIPGSAIFGDVLLSGVDSASVAPGGQAALATRGGQSYLVSAIASANPAWTSLNVNPAAVAWTPDASTAVVVGDGQVEVFQSTPDGFQLQSQYAFDAAAQVCGAAVDSKGTAVLLAVASPDAGGVYRIALDSGAAETVLALSGRLALASAASGDVFVFEMDAARVHRIQGFGPDAAVADFPVAADPSADFTGIAASPDGRQIAVADRTAPAVLVYDNTGVAIANLGISFDPGPPNPLGNGISALSSGTDGQPFYFLDFSVPRVFFVPAAAPQSAAN